MNLFQADASIMFWIARRRLTALLATFLLSSGLPVLAAETTNAPTPVESKTSGSAPNRASTEVSNNALPSTEAAQQADASSRTGYQSFKLILDRNIFNPNRLPGGTQAARKAEKPVRAESFSLVGTMSYEKGDYAVFDGTSSSFRKVFKLSDNIAGFKIAEIHHDHVKLESNGKKTELKIGSQMKRQGEGEWQMAGQAGVYAKSGKSSGSSDETSTSSGMDSSSSDGPANDVLKRLMERRKQQESKK